jgi:RNA polymerase sigma-70 factor, ECF subfamily
MKQATKPSHRTAPDLLMTSDLLTRAQGGDRAAVETLIMRYRPRLERWASGRLPLYARSLFDTGDIIQETLLKAIENLGEIEVRGPGSFEAYVRRSVLNRVRDQIRWARRRPPYGGEMEAIPDVGPSPLESAIGEDVIARYEAALEKLSEEERQLIHFRIELALGYDEIAAMTGRVSPDATRMAIQRALRRLAEHMGV